MRYVLVALVLLFTSGAILIQMGKRDGGETKALRVFAAAGLRPGLESAAAAYQRETGQAVELHWGGTGALYGQIVSGAACDAFIPGDAWTARRGEAAGLLTIVAPVATQRPTLAVATGNPRGIGSWDDLLRDDVSVSMADPDQAATGRAVREALGPPRWERLAARVRVLKPTVADSATDVQLGAVDAAFVWDHMAIGSAAWEGLEGVELSSPSFVAEAVFVTLVEGSANDRARAFAEWLSDRQGREHFRKAGFGEPEPDAVASASADDTSR